MPRAGAAARKQEKLALQSEAKSAARESHKPRVVDACCAKVMNEFVKSSGKPPALLFPGKLMLHACESSLITVVAVRLVLARLGANVRSQTVPEVTVCLSL